MAAAPPSGLIDTDILIDELRGLAPAATFLSAQRSFGSVRISIVSAMELVQGCRNSADLRSVRGLLRRVVVLPVSSAASEAAFGLMDALFLGHGLRIPDALIAATALDYQLALYTKNVRHFQAVPGLSVLRPY